jgi:hypothetical protein
MTALDTSSNMIPWVLADSTGRLLFAARTIQLQIDGCSPAEGQEIALGVGNVNTDYVKDHVITPRPVNSSVLTGMTISNISNPSTVAVDGGEPSQVTDGEVDLEFTQPGTYTVVVSGWPELDAVFEVTQA